MLDTKYASVDDNEIERKRTDTRVSFQIIELHINLESSKLYILYQNSKDYVEKERFDVSFGHMFGAGLSNGNFSFDVNLIERMVQPCRPNRKERVSV